MYFVSYSKISVPYRNIMNGESLPNKVNILGQAHGEKTLLKNSNLAFPGFSWLNKGFNNNINDVKKRKSDLKLSGACIVTENPYDMLNGRNA